MEDVWKDEEEKKIYCKSLSENAGLRKLGQNKSLISIEKIVFPRSAFFIRIS